MKFFKAIDKKKLLTGILEKITENQIKLKTEEKEFDINIDDISSAKILYNWEE